MKARVMFVHPSRCLFTACLLALLPLAVFAQQQPLTGQMMGAQRATTPSTAPSAASSPGVTQTASVEPASFHASETGDTTRHLLQMQADNSRAGNQLPILGDEASASYDRYMKSFSHDIPDFYESSVGKDSGSGR